jgi:hypothetical protein
MMTRGSAMRASITLRELDAPSQVAFQTLTA